MKPVKHIASSRPTSTSYGKLFCGRWNFSSYLTGFIPGRLFFNKRCLLNIIYSTNLPHFAVFSLDAQQASDQVEWRYMFAALEKFSFGVKFMTLLRMLYACQRSSVLTNYDRSPPISLCRGTRQGRCLSPILFALDLEPLAIGIRASPQISGIRCVASDYTFGLYADDVVLTPSDVRTSFSPLLGLIDNFGRLSGFTINGVKSTFMPLLKIHDHEVTAQLF